MDTILSCRAPAAPAPLGLCRRGSSFLFNHTTKPSETQPPCFSASAGHGYKKEAPPLPGAGFPGRRFRWGPYFSASATATATATVAPTMGLLPMPKKPIISTWAGTEEEPANWASECIRPMVSVMP